MFFLFFSAVILVQSGRKFQKNVKMYLKQKIIFSEKANGTIFRMVMKNNPANFVFELLFNQGAKA